MEPTRSGWFDCSCCPTNLTRLIPSIPGYVYAQKGDAVYVNLFINSRSALTIQNKPIVIEQQNRYPWDGNLVFAITPSKTTAFNLLVRIPGWAQNEAIPSDLYRFANTVDQKPVIKINGQPIEYSIDDGYATIARTWKKKDVVEVVLPMEVRQVTANEKVKDDIGKVALQRGPLMYCAEWVDNNGRAANIIIPGSTSFSAAWKPALLNGVEVLNGEVPVITIDKNGQQVSTIRQPFTAIPYYAWANRGKGEMMLWFPQKINDIEVIAGSTGNTIISK